MKATEVRRLPRQVDVLKLCQQSLTLEGQVSLAELPRLVEALSVETLSAEVGERVLLPVLQFSVDDEGHRLMQGHLEISLPVVCQRCLEIMEYPIQADMHCAFVVSDEQAKNLPGHLEPVMLETDATHTALYDLLEDELLLSLPIAARHEHCREQPAETQQQTEARKKPFADLAELLNKPGLKQE
jgi:uncharacterized protein